MRALPPHPAPPSTGWIAAALVALAGATPGCLEDLPGASACPADPKHEASDCSAAIEKVSATDVAQCFQPADMSCLSGARPCTCLSDECPAPPEACYPPPDCPARVREEGHPDAECLRLDPSDVGAGFPSESQCLCGCAGCATVCDGVGPVLGVLDNGYGGPDDYFGFLPPYFAIERWLPDRGTLGVYLRVRGLATPTLYILRGDFTVEEFDVLASHVILTPLGNDFVEHVVFDQSVIGVEAYSWDSPDQKPTHILFDFGASEKQKQVALFELDCLVPFVVAK